MCRCITLISCKGFKSLSSSPVFKLYKSLLITPLLLFSDASLKFSRSGPQIVLNSASPFQFVFWSTKTYFEAPVINDTNSINISSSKTANFLICKSEDELINTLVLPFWPHKQMTFQEGIPQINPLFFETNNSTDQISLCLRFTSSLLKSGLLIFKF